MTIVAMRQWVKVREGTRGIGGEKNVKQEDDRQKGNESGCKDRSARTSSYNKKSVDDKKKEEEDDEKWDVRLKLVTDRYVRKRGLCVVRVTEFRRVRNETKTLMRNLTVGGVLRLRVRLSTSPFVHVTGHAWKDPFLRCLYPRESA